MPTTPVNDAAISHPPPARPGPTWDEAVLGQLNDHVAAERGLISEYADALSGIDAADVRYLMGLILEDEARHHRMFEELVNALKGARSGRQVEPRLPGRAAGPLPGDVLRVTERFLQAEREDRRQLKALRRRLSPVADTTMWALIVDLMAIDTEKHIRILEAIASRGPRPRRVLSRGGTTSAPAPRGAGA
jgi:bacterioferritin (cytochrome b1)